MKTRNLRPSSNPNNMLKAMTVLTLQTPSAARSVQMAI